MAETFDFELVSPEKLLFSKPVAMVTAPGCKGEYGVLPGHAPMITEIKPGLLRIYENEDTVVTNRLFVNGGFAEVTQTRFTVLANEAIPISELKLETLQALVKDLDQKIADANSEEEREPYRAEQDFLAVKILAATS
ncbi:MAG: ATP synthase F1 subunit epsilon [Alphaproteobacteria bacterium]|nr:ATP synthase F1 subunit epsilon [Alphaproteobacteria bacterium]